MKYDLVMVTPFINRVCIFEFLNSLLINQKIHVCVVLVDMSDEIGIMNLSVFENDFIKFVYLKQEKKHGLSEARNIALQFLFEQKIFDYRYLMFPDDDTSFDVSFFDKFKEMVNGEGAIIDTLCKGSSVRYINSKVKDGVLLDKKGDYRFIGSVSLIFSKNLVEKIGFFDERMGVGARYGAAEDSDYFIRSLEFTSLNYIESLYTFHPAPSVKYSAMSLSAIVMRFSNYGKGVVFLLCKHKMFIAAMGLVLRGFGGSLFSFAKFKFRLSFAYFVATWVRLKYLIKFSMKGIDRI